MIGTGAGTPGASGTNTDPFGIGGSPYGTLPLSSGAAIKRVIVRNGIAGPTVVDVDFTSQTNDAQSFTCSTGQTVTVNGCARPTVTITAANAVGAQWGSVAGALTDDYWRISYTISGTNPVFAFAVSAGVL